MKILVFYVDKQYFNMVILFLRLRVSRLLTSMERWLSG